jgi:hypothetical protein
MRPDVAARVAVQDGALSLCLPGALERQESECCNARESAWAGANAERLNRSAVGPFVSAASCEAPAPIALATARLISSAAVTFGTLREKVAVLRPDPPRG